MTFLLGVSQKRTTLRRDIQKFTIEIDRDEDVHDDASTKKWVNYLAKWTFHVIYTRIKNFVLTV